MDVNYKVARLTQTYIHTSDCDLIGTSAPAFPSSSWFVAQELWGVGQMRKLKDISRVGGETANMHSIENYTFAQHSICSAETSLVCLTTKFRGRMVARAWRNTHQMTITAITRCTRISHRKPDWRHAQRLSSLYWQSWRVCVCVCAGGIVCSVCQQIDCEFQWDTLRLLYLWWLSVACIPLMRLQLTTQNPHQQQAIGHNATHIVHSILSLTITCDSWHVQYAMCMCCSPALITCNDI